MGGAETVTRIRSLGNHYSERSNSVFIAVYKSDTSSNSVLISQLFLLKPASLPSPPEQTKAATSKRLAVDAAPAPLQNKHVARQNCTRSR